jgi:hypothetical protein
LRAFFRRQFEGSRTAALQATESPKGYRRRVLAGAVMLFFGGFLIDLVGW